MFAVIFEVEPWPERWEEYLRYAALLRPELERIEGFRENRRFRSRRHPGRLLSLSLWRDEKAVVRWRSHGGHHAIQAKGRAELFRDYHLRVGEVTAENGVALPQLRFDATEAGAARLLSLIEQPSAEEPAAADGGPVDWDMFDGVLDPADRLLLLSWRDVAGAAPDGARRRDVRVIRDYGLWDRAEAPQYHAPVHRDVERS
jgi:heme-degrading monooxygenase HmoA